MCCKLQNEWEERLSEVRHQENPITAWKTLRVVPTSTHGFTLISPYQGTDATNNGTGFSNIFAWQQGENVSNRTNPKMMPIEIKEKSVTFGIHSFLHQQDAEDFLKIITKHQGDTGFVAGVVLPVTISQKNVIAIGNCDYGSAEVVVATKATLTETPTLKNVITNESYQRSQYSTPWETNITVDLQPA